MSIATTITDDEVFYPETDGKPMGDNTLQIKWMTMLYCNLDTLFINDQNVFVACNLMWYPVKGNNKKATAPDVMVALGRPKGDRSSYKQWEEDGVPPTVVFEILSPGNTPQEMDEKFRFFQRYGVEEYYIYDPYENALQGFLRDGKKLKTIPNHKINAWESPRLKIRFDLTDDNFVIWKPDGNPFLSHAEVLQRYQEEYLRAEAEKKHAEAANKKAEAEKKRADNERKKNEALIAKLKARGIDPDQL